MIFNTKELQDVLSKISPIVTESSVMDELRAFHFLPLPNERKVLIGGTDSNMTIIKEVAYTPSDNSDNSKVIVESDKLVKILKSASDKIEFMYTKDVADETVKIKTRNTVILLKKHIGFSEEVIDFHLGRNISYDDSIKASHLKFLNKNIVTLIDNAEPNTSAKTVFLLGDEVVVGSDNYISTLKFHTKEKYEIGIKAFKILNTIISSLSADDIVEMKNVYKNNTVLVKTKDTVYEYTISDTYLPDMDVLDDFESHSAVLVSKEEFIQRLKLVSATSNENKVRITLDESEVTINTQLEDETTNSILEVPSSHVRNILTFEYDIPHLIKTASIINSEGLVLSIDKEASILVIRDPRKRNLTALAIDLISE